MSLTIRHILDISSCSQRHCCSSSLFTGLCNINISLACTTSTCHWVFNPHSLIKWDDDVIFCSRSLFTGLFEFSFHWVVQVLFSLGCSRSFSLGYATSTFHWVVNQHSPVKWDDVTSCMMAHLLLQHFSTTFKRLCIAKSQIGAVYRP